jgi:hypothetical protein
MTKPDETARAGQGEPPPPLLPEAEGDATTHDAPLTPEEERLVDAIDRAEAGEESSPFLKVIQTLKQAPVASAPPDFLSQVQTKIRDQSGGRYYGYQWRSRLPSGFLMILMLAVVVGLAIMLAIPTPTPRPLPTAPPPITLGSFDGPMSDLGLAAAILSAYGDVQNEGLTTDGVHRRLAVELAKARIAAFEAEISLFPALRIEGEPEPTLDPNSVLMRVLVPVPRAPK